MKTARLDLLEKSPWPPAQARALLQVMESELTSRDTDVATKADLPEVDREIAALRVDIEKMGGRLLRWNFAFGIAQIAAIAGILKLLR